MSAAIASIAACKSVSSNCENEFVRDQKPKAVEQLQHPKLHKFVATVVSSRVHFLVSTVGGHLARRSMSQSSEGSDQSQLEEEEKEDFEDSFFLSFPGSQQCSGTFRQKRTRLKAVIIGLLAIVVIFCCLAATATGRAFTVSTALFGKIVAPTSYGMEKEDAIFPCIFEITKQNYSDQKMTLCGDGFCFENYECQGDNTSFFYCSSKEFHCGNLTYCKNFIFDLPSSSEASSFKRFRPISTAPYNWIFSLILQVKNDSFQLISKTL